MLYNAAITGAKNRNLKGEQEHDYNQDTVEKSRLDERPVDGQVRAKALSAMQQFRFTVKTPIQNHGVEIGYSGYPDYDPMKYDIYSYTIIAFSFDDAIEMVRYPAMVA